MISKAYLELLVASWPNNEGLSQNPDVYNAWIERERRYNARIIQNALGVERILNLSSKQKILMENTYAELLLERDITDIADQQIIGKYELITEHILPTSVEHVVDSYMRKQKVN